MYNLSHSIAILKCKGNCTHGKTVWHEHTPYLLSSFHFVSFIMAIVVRIIITVAMMTWELEHSCSLLV